MTISETGGEIGNHSDQYELDLNFNRIQSNKFGIELFASETEGLVLEFDREQQIVSLNRENFEAEFGREYGYVRSAEFRMEDFVKVQVFVDHSIAEIFINDGEVVFTARVFPKAVSKGIRIFSEGNLSCSYTLYELAQGIPI